MESARFFSGLKLKLTTHSNLVAVRPWGFKSLHPHHSLVRSRTAKRWFGRINARRQMPAPRRCSKAIPGARGDCNRTHEMERMTQFILSDRPLTIRHWRGKGPLWHGRHDARPLSRLCPSTIPKMPACEARLGLRRAKPPKDPGFPRPLHTHRRFGPLSSQWVPEGGHAWLLQRIHIDADSDGTEPCAIIARHRQAGL